MSSKIKLLTQCGHFTPDRSFVSETVYEVIMGSTAYGVAKDSSDIDIYAVCIPPKHIVFPHLAGNLIGFGPQPETFNEYQKHRMVMGDSEYDAVVYSIIKYFALCADNNPNMIDSLFVPDNCIIHQTDAGKHMRDSRLLFLSKRCYDKMRGFAFSEFKKIERGYNQVKGGKREAIVKEFGYDTKSSYHVMRLLLQAEYILNVGDLDLQQCKEQLKFVREGGYTKKEFTNWFHNKENDLSTVHANSKLQDIVDYNLLKILLKECLEIHFGTLADAHFENSKAIAILQQIKQLID